MGLLIKDEIDIILSCDNLALNAVKKMKDGRHFAEDILGVFLLQTMSLFCLKFCLKFVIKGLIKIKSVLVKVMA